MPEPTWSTLTQSQRMSLLRDLSDEEILKQYRPDGVSTSDFEREIYRSRDLWKPDNIGTEELIGQPPRKESIIGAFRDLNKSEAILELTDNSIDAWLRRRAKYPEQTSPELLIFIGIDTRLNFIRYEDNAGGVPHDNLVNLVIPGYSETQESDRTIGSYKTGGKKAIFKLASEVNITTRYWSPVGSGDEAYSIHLDEQWLEDPIAYEFPIFPLTNKSEIEKGQTLYTLAIRKLDRWNQETIDEIRGELSKTYTLLMLRYPQIKIYVGDRDSTIEPLSDLYSFSDAKIETTDAEGAKVVSLDIRPQRLIFKTEVEWKGISEPVEIEIVLGCRTTVAATRGDDVWGIDLYGNHRLFRLYDQEEIPGWYDAPRGQARQYMRGYINIKAPNALVPWDTHKRHLNSDREIVTELKKRSQIKDFFTEWMKVYNAVSSQEEIRSKIRGRFTPIKTVPKEHRKEVNTASTKTIPLSKNRGARLPQDTPRPILPIFKITPSSPSSTDIELKIVLSKEEWRQICMGFGITGTSENRDARIQLAEAIKTMALRKKS